MKKAEKKHFRKLSILLSAILTLTVTGTGNAAAAVEMPENGWYQPKYHSDLDYSEMDYTGFDRTRIDAALRELDEICSLGQTGQENRISELYEIIVSEIDLYNTQCTLNDLLYYKDVHNEAAQEESQKLSKTGNEIGDNTFITLKKALKSPYGPLLREKVGDIYVEQLEDYQPMTEREFELSAQELSLVQEYDQAMMDSYTVTVDGEEWTTERYRDEPPEDEDDAYAIYLALSKEMNGVIAEIYKEMIQVRNGIAQENGYDNYADYAYKEIYERDFTTEEIKQVYEEVKAQMGPLYTDVMTAQLTTDVDALKAAGDGKTGEEILDALEPYFGKVHPQLAEAYDYMRAHHLYDIDSDNNKMDVGFTVTLYSYGVPFIFNSPYGEYSDYSTVIHEFGHYNQAFHSQTPSIWELSRMDVYEIHSQGLEMLFYPYADDIFGEGGDAFRYEMVYRMLHGVREGCVYDEFQNTVYKNPDMSIEEINKTFLKIATEYGYEYMEDADQAYEWINVPHTFESPMYYIGYATSALSSLDIWLESLDNRDEVINKYMYLSSLGATLPYKETIKACGLKDIFQDGVITDIAKKVRSTMHVDEKVAEYDRTVAKEKQLQQVKTAIKAVILLAAVILLLVLIVLFLRKRKRRMLAQAEMNETGGELIIEDEGKTDDDHADDDQGELF